MSKARCAASRTGANGHAKVVGVAVRDPFRGRYELTSRVVVDASGHTGFVARETGLRPGNDRSAVGMELELHAPAYDQDEVIFWLGDDIAPGGYGWAFPCGDGRVRLGVGVVRPNSDAEPRALLESLRAEFVRLVGPGAGAGPIEMHSGLMPVLRPDATTLVGDGIVVTGDAAGQGSTLLGEGIRYAIQAGRGAGQAIVAAGGDYSARGLASYPREWHRTRRPQPEDLVRRQRADLRLQRRRLGSRDPADGQADARPGRGRVRQLVQPVVGGVGAVDRPVAGRARSIEPSGSR